MEVKGKQRKDKAGGLVDVIAGASEDLTVDWG